MKKQAVKNLEAKLSSSLSGTDYDEVQKQVAECTTLQLDSKYKLFKPVDKLIESIKFANDEFAGDLDDK